jgi:hypothetical protein
MSPPASPPERRATRVIKTIDPQDPGARRWAQEYGERLLCLRYRVDPRTRKRLTTVELVVDAAPTLASLPVALRIAWHETALREAVKTAGGKWDASSKLWMLAYGAARDMGLKERIVNGIP